MNCPLRECRLCLSWNLSFHLFIGSHISRRYWPHCSFPTFLHSFLPGWRLYLFGNYRSGLPVRSMLSCISASTLSRPGPLRSGRVTSLPHYYGSIRPLAWHCSRLPVSSGYTSATLLSDARIRALDISSLRDHARSPSVTQKGTRIHPGHNHPATSIPSWLPPFLWGVALWQGHHWFASAPGWIPILGNSAHNLAIVHYPFSSCLDGDKRKTW